MRILLVNNNTKHLQKLSKALAGHEVEVQIYRPGIDFHTSGKDLVILSGGGGEGREMQDYHAPHHLWYEDEIEFVRSTDKPVLGICMGFEIIAAAYGSEVTKMPQKIDQFTGGLRTTTEGSKFLQAQELWQLESHDWRIQNVSPKHFEVLAQSDTGVEIIKHKTRPILATQFHPEFPGGTLKLQKLIKTLAA